MAKDSSQLHQIMRHAVRYVGATYIFQLVTLAVGLVTKRFLGPESVGIWATCGLVTSYLWFASLGITDGAQKEIAYRRGRGEMATAELLRNVMFTVWMAASLALGLGVVIVAWLVHPENSPKYLIGLLTVGMLFPLTQIIICYTVMFRCHKRFSLLSRTFVIMAIANAALQIPLTIVWGFYGFLIAYALVQVINWAYWRFGAKAEDCTRFHFVWDWPILRRLLAIGIPIQVGSVIYIVLRSLDQVILLSVLGPVSLGMYSVGVSMTNFVYNIPNAVSIVTFPNFQERFGQTDSRSALIDLIVSPVLVLAFVVLPLAVGGTYLFLPALIRQALPDFAPGIAAAQVLAMGTFALSLNHMPNQFMITINKQIPSILLNLVATGVLVVAVYTSLHFKLGITGAAAATALAYVFSSTSLLLLAVTMASSWARALRLVFQCSVAMGWTWLVLWLTDRLVPSRTSSLWWDFGSSALKFAVFIVLVLPLFWYLERTTGMLSLAVRSFRTRPEEGTKAVNQCAS